LRLSASPSAKPQAALLTFFFNVNIQANKKTAATDLLGDCGSIRNQVVQKNARRGLSPFLARRKRGLTPSDQPPILTSSRDVGSLAGLRLQAATNPKCTQF
jgi:hypothetical protein